MSSIGKAGKILSGCFKTVAAAAVTVAALTIIATPPAAADDMRHFHGRPIFHDHDRFVFRGGFFPDRDRFFFHDRDRFFFHDRDRFFFRGRFVSGPFFAPAPVVVAPVPYYGYVPGAVIYSPPRFVYPAAPIVVTPSVNVMVTGRVY